MISGSSSEAISTQTTHIVKSMGVTAREEIIKKLDVVIKISPEQVEAMKSCLSIPWNIFREMRRWLATFKVSIASEELSRKVREAWIGDGLGIERQVYHGSCFVGNQCHTLLKEKNIIVLCESIPSVVSKKMAEFQFSADICEHTVIVAGKFKTLFIKYSLCDLNFNSSIYFGDEEISQLAVNINEFMSYLRTTWPEIRITPKASYA